MIAWTFVIFFGLCLISIPVACVLVLTAIVALAMFSNVDPMSAVQILFTSIDSYPLMAAPFFIIAGGILQKGGVASRLVTFAKSILGWLPGGMAVVTFFSCVLFGAISGSATATVAAIGSIMLPFMLADGYDLKFSLATVASGGYLGIIIPPSVPMVLYGVTVGCSISDLFSGGLIPGVLLAGAMSVYAVIYGRKHKDQIEIQKFSLKEVGRSFVDAIWALIMPAIILGGIYGGVCTPTESAAIAILYGTIVGFFVYKELTLKKFINIFRDSVVNVGAILFVVATASVFAYYMSLMTIPAQVANAILSIAHSKIVFWIIVNILLFFVGMVMDLSPAILVLAPLLYPVASSFGVSPVLFGLIMIINLGIGLTTPPVGLNLYVATNLRTDITIKDVVCKHLLWYILCSTAVIILLILIPDLVLLLPSLIN